MEKKTKRPIVMIASMLKTKDNIGYFRPFKNLVDEVYTIPLTSSDAGLCPKILAELAQKAGLMASPQADLQEALLKISLKHKEAIIFIGGSLYLAGNILRDNETPPC
ncbi:hypothetical protein H709_01204 [Bartonella bacilliformis CUSCO5]|nr:hypothetical protein X470_00176 [Bartonella bacilliformis Peru-18]KEG16086.1 hypothetical protein H709_01204 [Bartonella bacilliformis CUSCO5]KEG21708.1 hypothetical protein H703_01224 [Bartonella bacilliformis Ver075]